MEIAVHVVEVYELNVVSKPLRRVVCVVAGKSTLVRNLAAALGGVAIGTPPPQLSELRKAFDGQPPALRRAFYSAANYVAARQVLDECQQRPVIMDRWEELNAALLSEFIMQYAIEQGFSTFFGFSLDDDPMRMPTSRSRPPPYIFVSCRS